MGRSVTQKPFSMFTMASQGHHPGRRGKNRSGTWHPGRGGTVYLLGTDVSRNVTLGGACITPTAKQLVHRVGRRRPQASCISTVPQLPRGTAKVRAPNARNLADTVYPILWGGENFRVVTTQHALQWRARPVIHSRFVGLCV